MKTEYPCENKYLEFEVVEEIIRYIAMPDDEPWEIRNAKREEISRLINRALRLHEVSSDYYIIPSTLSLSYTIGLIHTCLGGLEETNNRLMKLTKDALEYLAILGETNQFAEDYWIIAKYPLRIYGNGKNWVYLYYLSGDKTGTEVNASESSHSEGEWKCNIGRTKSKKPVEGRILKETRQFREKVITELLLRTDEEIKLESGIHIALKLRGKHIPPEDINREREWFITNPDKVIEIYEFFMGVSPSQIRRD